MKTLILRFRGMQSWGDSSKETHRHTRSDPTFSGTLGILGAAMDIRLESPEFDPFIEFEMATRVHRAGVQRKDYHVASDFLNLLGKPKQKGTAVCPTHRWYLADADFFVALSGQDGLVDKAGAALKRPAYHLCLGRLAFAPMEPIFYGISEDAVPIDALKKLDVAPVKNPVRFIITARDEPSFSDEIVNDHPRVGQRKVRSIWLSL